MKKIMPRKNFKHDLAVPLSVGIAWVPMGIPEGEYDLLIQTLYLWKRRLVTQKPQQDYEI